MNSNLKLIFVLLISTCTFGQDKMQLSDIVKMTETDSLYLIAIEKYTFELDELYRNRPKEVNDKVIYIQAENYLRLIPNKVNGYTIQKLGVANRKKYFRANKNELYLVEISGLKIENGRFKITLIPYYAKLKGRKNLYLSLSSWTNVYFKYVDGKLIYDETENGGI